jgi:hypothetical protein
MQATSVRPHRCERGGRYGWGGAEFITMLSMGLRETTAQHEHLLAQLNEERISALVRISKTLESLLAQLHDARIRVAGARGDARARELATYRDLHQRATLYRWYLEVQREALGIRHHQGLDEFYAIPAPIER